MATQVTDTSKPRPRAHGDELAVIAQRAQAFTNASGTAIALSEGNADEIICRAKSGAAAPDVGTALRVEGSFTGLCIQSGKELRCDDAETDTRVDTAAIRSLGIRSMVVTPIKEDNKVVGVLACFAPTAHAFTITHVAVLKTMADQISVLLQKERRAREEGFAPEPSPVVTMPKPVASAPVTPAAVVIKPAVTPPASGNVNNGASATAAAPARSQFPVVSKVEPARSAEPAPAAKKEEKRAEARASFGTFDSLATEDKKSGLNVKLIGAVAVLVVAAVVTFALLKMRKSDATSTHGQETAQTSNTQPQAAPASASAASVPVSATSNSSASTSDAVVSNHTSSHNSSPAASAEVRKSERNTAEKGRATEPSEKPEKQAPATVALTSGPSRLSAGQGQQGGDVAAPTLNVGGSNSNALSALARPVNSNAPAASLAQSELEPMKLIRSVPPVYPPIAKVRRLSGEVVVEVKVGKDGRVTNPKFISGQPIFRDAAFDAVKQWVFRPAKLNGEPIEQTTQIKVDFRP